MRLNRSYIPLFGPLSGLLNGSYPIVKNAQNQVSYHGVTDNGIDHFHNIFYAEDTSGPNRFAPPVPYTPPPGTIVDATAPGAWCPQATGGPPLPFTSPINNVSENCLSLRIARISGTQQSAKLPVLVWIHGGTQSRLATPIVQALNRLLGGDALGSASDQLYTPDGLLHQANANLQPVIYVGINYRLGSTQSQWSKRLSLQINKIHSIRFRQHESSRNYQTRQCRTTRPACSVRM